MVIKKSNNFGLLLFEMFLLLFFGLLFVLGTFFDESIAIHLYSPDFTFVKYVTSCGVFPFFAFAVLFIGALCERIIQSQLNKIIKVVLAFLCYLTATAVGFIGAGSFVDKDSLGGLYPVLNRNIPVIAGISIVILPLLLWSGYHLAKKTEDKNLVLKIVCLLILLALAYASLQILKSNFPRARYRLVVQGYENIGFRPWYMPLEDTAKFINDMGIDKGEFRSFPSGHSILSMCMVMILQSLTWFSQKLKDKRIILGVLGAVFSMIIIFTRLMLGAHYMSDVSAGAIIVAFLTIVYTLIQNKLDSCSIKSS